MNLAQVSLVFAGCFLFVTLSRVDSFGICYGKSAGRRSFATPVVDPGSVAAATSGVSVESLAVTLGITVEEVVNIGVAVASAAAGAASQLPRIQELETQLAASRAELNTTVIATNAKIEELEDKLFLFDQEFEEQTEKFKKKYDAKVQIDLKNKVEKIKQDYKFKLDIEVEKEKSKVLSEQLDVVNTITGKRQEELATLRLKKQSMDLTNRELEKALEESEAELTRLREQASKRGGLFGLFA